MIIVKTVNPVCLIDGIYYLGVTVSNRVGGPAILEIDILFAIQIPDEVALGLADDNLVRTTITTLRCTLAFGLEANSIPPKGDTTLQHGLRFGASDLETHV
jgi:hypothetical protein